MADGQIHETHRERVDKRLATLRGERALVEPDWRELRDNFLPTRGRFDRDGGEDRSKRNRKMRLPNSTPVRAVRTAGSGLHAGLTAPSRPWFKFSLYDEELAEYGPVKVWLADAEEVLRKAFALSGLYQALPVMYEEFTAFGTMCGCCWEDDRNPRAPFRFDGFTVGQYFLGVSHAGAYDTMYRERTYTVRQVVAEFGLANVSPETAAKWKTAKYEHPVAVLHTVEPARSGGGWESCYWEMRCKDKREGLLARRRFDENPILAAPWQRVYGETYGSNCPGMIALGDARALQVDELDKARALQRHHNPPLQGPVLNGRAGISLRPGDYNEIPGYGQTAGAKIDSMYGFTPDIGGLLDNIRRGEDRINQAFYTDLFLMLTMDERAQRATAEEIRARYDEKVLALGPTLEQSNVMLRTLMDRAFGIMVRRSQPYWNGVLDGEPLLPPPPEDLQDQEIQVEFVSTLQQAMRATSLQGIERFAMFAGQMAQLTGRPPDKLDAEQALDEYAAALGVPPRIVRSDEDVADMQAAAAQAQAMQQMAAMAPAAKDGAQAAKALTEAGQAGGGDMLAALAGGVQP